MVFLIAYAISSLLTFFLVVGWEYANFQRRYPRVAAADHEQDKKCAIKLAFMAAVWGPIGLIFPFIGDYPCTHGWLWPFSFEPSQCAK